MTSPAHTIPDFGGNFSTLDISTRNSPDFLYQWHRIHWRYIFLHIRSTHSSSILQAFFNARRSFSVNIQISRLETSELSLTHQLENNLTIGRTRKAVGKPTPPRRLGCRLVFRKHFSIFRSSTRVFSIYTVILKWKTFSISQTNTWFT